MNTYQRYELICRCGWSGYTNIIRRTYPPIQDDERICPNCGAVCSGSLSNKPFCKVIGKRLVGQHEF